MELSVQAQAIQGKIQEAEAVYGKAWEEAGAGLDFSKVKAFGSDLTTIAVAEKINETEKELSALQDELKSVMEAEASILKRKEPTSILHPTPDTVLQPGMIPLGWPGNPAPPLKGLGQQIVEHAGYQAMLKMGGEKKMSFEIPGYGIRELKTLFQTSAGWAPESIRSGVVVDAVTRPIQLIDIMPPGNISQAAAVYMEETTRTHSAAETAEGAAYPESTFVLTERSETVRKIADSVPVTDEQLEDVAFAQSYLENRIGFGLRQRLDNQTLNGSGVAPNLTGILNKSGIQTQAKGADPVPDAIFKAMTLVRVTGRAVPTHTILHPNDWQEIRLLRTADGIYIWGNPSEAGPERIWGLPVVQADSISEGTGLVGSFLGTWIQLLERRGAIIEMGFVGTQFTEGEQTIRGSLRTVLVIYRAAAFATVTGI